MKAGKDASKCQAENGGTNTDRPSSKEKYHTMFQNEIKAKNIEDNLRNITSEPHMAGSKRQESLAVILADKWRKYGFDVVEMPEYKVPLSLPQEDKPNQVEIIRNGTIRTTILGKVEVRAEPTGSKTFNYIPYFAYSPNGTVEGELVYINRGYKDDIDHLNRTGVSLKNKIVIARSIFSWTHYAVALGAVGALVFPEPPPSGHSPNDTYPNTRWTSGEAIPERPVATNWGDPRTPGMPSIDGMYRGSMNMTKFAPIPIQPISYNDALILLKQLKGPRVPKEWQASFNVSFGLGPGFIDTNTTVRLHVNNIVTEKSIYNVIGTIHGREEPDRYVIIGSHRDAWFFGAADPSSGTAALMEISRAASKMLGEGWRPRRTVKFCSWGAEEFGLVGSVEWVEQNEKILQDRAVVYLNTDVAVGGDYVLVSQNCPLLSTAIFSWAKKVKDPNAHGSKTSLFDIMVERNPSRSNPGEPYVVPYTYYSDYYPFYMYTGIPSADFSYFFGPGDPVTLYPVYHTQEDNFFWMKKIDPDFKFHEAVTKFEGGLLIELADCLLLPFDVTRYAKTLKTAYKNLTKVMTDFPGISTDYVREALYKFGNASEAFDQAKSKLNPDLTSPLRLRRLNDQMVQVEKVFISPLKLSKSYLMRHVFTSTGTPFPGVIEAYSARNRAELERQISLVVETISSAAQIIQPVASV